jgi:hypothetical protein
MDMLPVAIRAAVHDITPSMQATRRSGMSAAPAGTE